MECKKRAPSLKFFQKERFFDDDMPSRQKTANLMEIWRWMRFDQTADWLWSSPWWRVHLKSTDIPFKPFSVHHFPEVCQPILSSVGNHLFILPYFVKWVSAALLSVSSRCLLCPASCLSALHLSQLLWSALIKKVLSFKWMSTLTFKTETLR